jgi:DNA-binding MarR family transcriptional regulator
MEDIEISRDKILQTLITSLTHVIRGIHSKSGFPFGNLTLNFQQIMMLFFITEKKEGVIVKDLAKFLQVTPGAITQLVDTLIKYKLVERKTVISDRRSTKIILSPLAQKKSKKFKKDYLISSGQAFKNLNTKELQEFSKLIKKIKI